MLVANHGYEAKLDDAAEHASSYVGTSGVVTNIFRENFFAAIWSRDARLDRYPRNGEPLLSGYLHYVTDRGLLRK